MNHHDHVALLEKGILQPGGIWADIGSGDSAFTLALAELLGAGATIYSVDKDRRALERQARALRRRFPRTTLLPQVADFTMSLELPALDGLVMANALHFVRRGEQVQVVRQLKELLKPGGRFVIVEYNVDTGNRWVPYPLSYETWKRIAAGSGFSHIQLLATRSSSFLRGFYAAASW